jgi:hypothetical protein
VSHIVAFLILHEITAIVPVLGLWAVFHYTEYVPLGYVTRHWGAYVRDGVGKAERYFVRRGWFGFSKDDLGDGEAETGIGVGLKSTSTETETEDMLVRWASDDKYRVVVEVALAWAITKALLPVRIVASVWATPWFAGVMLRTRQIFKPR